MSAVTLFRDSLAKLDKIHERIGATRRETLDFVASHGPISPGVLNSYWLGYRTKPGPEQLDALADQIASAENALLSDAA